MPLPFPTPLSPDHMRQACAPVTAQDAIRKACVGSKSARPHYSADRGGRAIALPASPFSQREREERALSGCHANRAAPLSPLIIAISLAACGTRTPVADAAAGQAVYTAATGRASCMGQVSQYVENTR